MSKDYRVTIRVKNNRLLRRIEDAGYGSVLRFCKDYGLNYQVVVGLLSMRIRALKKNGEWTSVVANICDALGCNPEDIFNGRQAVADFKSTTAVREVDESDVISISSNEAMGLCYDGGLDEAVDRPRILESCFAAMTEREQNVVKRHYGLDGAAVETLDEIGISLGVSRERVRSIEAKAFERARRKLMGDDLDARRKCSDIVIVPKKEPAPDGRNRDAYIDALCFKLLVNEGDDGRWFHEMPRDRRVMLAKVVGLDRYMQNVS